MRHFVLLSLLMFSLSACSAATEDAGTPMKREDRVEAERGKLTGDGLFIWGDKNKETSSGSPIGVNSFLWRASLDTLSFMPLTSADPFGGTIITDWYEDPNARGERFKLNVLILDKTLRSDGVKITVFKQKMIGNSWRDQKVDDKLGRQLEDTILTRARQLKVAQGK